MTKTQALQALKQELHVSHSQITTYLNCPLKFRLMYVEQRPPERVSINLVFGSALHRALEVFWNSVAHGVRPPVSVLEEAFEDHLARDLNARQEPVIHKKDIPDFEGALVMGRRLLATYAESIQTDGFEVVGVEEPLSAMVYGPDGFPRDIQLVGVIDLLLMDEDGVLWAIDHKSSSKAYSQASVDVDSQMTAYDTGFPRSRE